MAFCLKSQKVSSKKNIKDYICTHIIMHQEIFPGTLPWCRGSLSKLHLCTPELCLWLSHGAVAKCLHSIIFVKIRTVKVPSYTVEGNS